MLHVHKGENMNVHCTYIKKNIRAYKKIKKRKKKTRLEIAEA